LENAAEFAVQEVRACARWDDKQSVEVLDDGVGFQTSSGTDRRTLCDIASVRALRTPANEPVTVNKKEWVWASSSQRR
jgi:hypothetical protein